MAWDSEDNESNTDTDLYYRLYISDNDMVRVVCMQWFDEMDYDQAFFLKSKDNEPLYFSSEEKAIQFMNDNLKPERIHEDFLRSTFNYHQSFYKD